MLFTIYLASKRKELHLFDTDINWENGDFFKLEKHYDLLEPSFESTASKNGPWNLIGGHLGEHKQLKPTAVINFETTPSYLASPDACARMSVALPRTTMFVLILRNPIERAWSEIQMKARRVESQQHFKEMFLECAPDLKQCFYNARKEMVKRKATSEKKTKNPSFPSLLLKDCIRQLGDQMLCCCAAPKIRLSNASLSSISSNKNQGFHFRLS